MDSIVLLVWRYVRACVCPYECAIKCKDMLGVVKSTGVELGSMAPCLLHWSSFVVLKQSVKVCLLSLQWLSAGVHDRHHDRVHAALSQTGAHPKTLPRYHAYAPSLFLSPISCPSYLHLSLRVRHTFLFEIICILSAVFHPSSHLFQPDFRNGI